MRGDDWSLGSGRDPSPSGSFYRRHVTIASASGAGSLQLAQKDGEGPVAVGLRVAVAAGSEEMVAGAAGVLEGVGEEGEEVGAELVADGAREAAGRLRVGVEPGLHLGFAERSLVAAPGGE